MSPNVTKKVSNQKIGSKKNYGRNAETSETPDIEDMRKVKQLVKPDNQLKLSESDLKEIINKALVTTNPQKQSNLVEYSYNEGKYIFVSQSTNLVVAYKHDGSLIHIDSDEASDQLKEMGYDPDEYRAQARETIEEEGIIEETKTELETKKDTPSDENDKVDAEDDEEEAAPISKDNEEEDHADGEEDEAEGERPVKTEIPKGRKKKLTNQFNFCERATLTINAPVRSQEVQTVPPPRANFSGCALQWVIYDAYQKDFEKQEAEKEIEREKREKEKSVISLRPKTTKKKLDKTQMTEAVKLRIAESWKVLERMINQNTFYEISYDYRYWEDPADEFREEEGTLLPLWKFSFDKFKKYTITDIEWNPFYNDLFAVSYGFLDFVKPTKDGGVCVYTLKNPSYPDYICLTHTAAMCVSTHPVYPYMMAVGLVDGCVLVFNIQKSCKQYEYRSNSVSNKHQGIVWQVKWAPDMPDGELNFYSIGSDGKVNNWVLMQNEMTYTTVFNLYFPMDPVSGPDGMSLKIRGSARCVAFHPKDPLIYLVGTEYGTIYECCTAYSSMFLFEYNAHHMPVNRIDFNRYNCNIFVSCSADWRIKIWEHKREEPLFVFDAGSSVCDVKWAPYSSTVFAAVTSTGKVLVFDLDINKYKAICEQAVVPKKRNKLTRLSFNNKIPVIIVGDDKGSVISLKLSPNLRVMCKPTKKQQHLDQSVLQCMKMDKLLALVREPETESPPQETTATEE
ncbi:hypothetical protein WA026_022439 [Henosepilachna vigintioctopunctata]|uniref:Dynein intermediate chain 2, ciliary n=1 Tax=Henosepilachna vigintioctopunctata TaxID=420089 RepID=A0AAW1UCW6_9CUCU